MVKYLAFGSLAVVLAVANSAAAFPRLQNHPWHQRTVVVRQSIPLQTQSALVVQSVPLQTQSFAQQSFVQQSAPFEAQSAFVQQSAPLETFVLVPQAGRSFQPNGGGTPPPPAPPTPPVAPTADLAALKTEITAVKTAVEAGNKDLAAIRTDIGDIKKLLTDHLKPAAPAAADCKAISASNIAVEEARLKDLTEQFTGTAAGPAKDVLGGLVAKQQIVVSTLKVYAPK